MRQLSGTATGTRLWPDLPSPDVMALVEVRVPEGGDRSGQGTEPDRDQDGEVARADSAAYLVIPGRPVEE